MTKIPDKPASVGPETMPRPPGLRQKFGVAWQKWQPRLMVVERALIAVAALAALSSTEWRQHVAEIWIAVNIIYGLIAVVWVVAHGRAVWHTRDSAQSWAICASLFSGLLIYTIQYKKFNNLNDISTLPVGMEANGAIWLLPIWFGLFGGFLLLALIGAAIGSFAGRRSGDSDRSARAGITLSMASAMAVILALTFAPDNPFLNGTGLGLCFCSFPLLTRLYISMGQRSARPLHHFLRHLARVERTFLVRRWRIPARHFGHKWPARKVTYTLDLRGIALGLVVASLLLRIPPRYIGPLQSAALTTLTHLHAARSLPLFHLPTDTKPRAVGARDQFAILRMDAQTRYEATQSSEAAVQVKMIRLLLQRGVARIILPLPYLHGRMIPTWTSREEGLAPNSRDVEQNRRDTRQLADLLRRAPNVVLAVPANLRADDPKIQMLMDAAPCVGNAALLRSPATYLPIVPETWTGRPPLPALLCAYLKAVPNVASGSPPPQTLSNTFANKRRLVRDDNLYPSTLNPQPSSLRAIPGCAKPQVYPDNVLIDFVGDGPREDFLHATYTEVRANTPLLSLHADSSDAASLTAKSAGELKPPPPEFPRLRVPTDAIKASIMPSGDWKPASELLRGRVVFLDSLPHPMVSTPAGVMAQSEAQAYATATLLTHEAFRRTSWRMFEWLTLLLCVAVGYTCARHEPLDAAIRLLVPLFTVIAYSLTEFLWNDCWFDPVLPLLAMGTTAAFATQFRFSRERADKQRASDLFGRFVAPHMVQAWLEERGEELGMGGIRERICVLFADARQFTAFAEHHDATEVIEVINVYMTALTDALHAHGGILDKYTGDGLMAFFQITEAVQEDLARAVQAALAMQGAVQTLSAKRANEGKSVLDFGITLHYGEAIVGLVGNPKQQVNYTAMGLTVVVAARLQTITQGGDVVVSEEVFQETQHSFVFVVGEPVQVKGLTQSVRPYRVLAAQAREEDKR